MSTTITSQSEFSPGLPPGVERLVMEIAAGLIRHTGEDAQAGMQKALRRIAKAVRAEHAIVCRLIGSSPEIIVEANYRAKTKSESKSEPPHAPLTDLPQLSELLDKREIAECPSTAVLDSKEERIAWQKLELGGGILVPLTSDGNLVGLLALNAKQDDWGLNGKIHALLCAVSPLLSAWLDRQSDSAAAKTNQNLGRVFESDLLPIFTWDSEGKITSANSAWLKMTGFDQQDVERGCLTIGNTTPVAFHEADKEFLQQVTEHGSAPNREKELLCADGSRVPVVMGGISVDGSGGVGFLLDLTERMATEASLRQSEERFRTLAQNVPGAVYMCRNDERYTMLYLNRAVEELTGYPPEAFLNNEVSFVELYHPEDVEFIRDEVNAALADQRPFHLQYRLRRSKDNWRWVEEHGQGVFSSEGQLLYLEGAVFDITDRKVAEEALRAAHHGLEQRVDERTEELRAANELLLSEVAVRRKMENALHNEKQFLKKTLDQHEADRRLTAYEIHDGLAQYVAGALMHFEAASREGDTPDEQLQHGLQLLRRTIDEARRLISGLRPPILDEQGIVAAIEYLINEHADLSELITLEVAEPFTRLSPLLESTLFRIVQEALNNIDRHAGAGAKIKISLHKDDDRIHLEVRDWGAGFDNKAVSKKAHGLRGIRERARLMGGNAAIHSKPGMGTLVVVEISEQEDPYMRVPLHGPKRAEGESPRSSKDPDTSDSLEGDEESLREVAGQADDPNAQQPEDQEAET